MLEEHACLQEVNRLLNCIPIAQAIYEEVLMQKRGIILKSIEREITVVHGFQPNRVYITCKQIDTNNRYDYIYHTNSLYKRFEGNLDFHPPA